MRICEEITLSIKWSESIPIELNFVKAELPQVGIIFLLNLLA